MLNNHDVVRHVTRYGGGARGLARARAATLTMLALPGSAYVYQGEELGLEQVDVAPEDRQDPVWLRTGEPGRDGCRIPIPWGGDRPPYAVRAGDAASRGCRSRTTGPASPSAAQEGDPDSTLAFYRRVLALRRRHALGAGAEVELLDLGREGAGVPPRSRSPSSSTAARSDADLPGGEVLVVQRPA